MMIYTPEKGIHEIKETTIEIDYTPSEHRPIAIVKSYSGGVYTKDVKIKPRNELYVQWDYVEEEL